MAWRLNDYEESFVFTAGSYCHWSPHDECVKTPSRWVWAESADAVALRVQLHHSGKLTRSTQNVRVAFQPFLCTFKTGRMHFALGFQQLCFNMSNMSFYLFVYLIVCNKYGHCQWSAQLIHSLPNSSGMFYCCLKVCVFLFICCNINIHQIDEVIFPTFCFQ